MNNDFLKDLGLDLHKDHELNEFYHQEKLILNITEIISELMAKNEVNKTQLAELLGKNKSYVTQLLDGSTNMTLKTVSNVFLALDCELNISANPLNSDFVQNIEYEAQDESQFINILPDNDLIEIHWSPKNNRMVA